MDRTIIYGAGGFGREALCAYIDAARPFGDRAFNVSFMVDDDAMEAQEIMGVNVVPRSRFNPADGLVVVAVGNSADRARMVASLPAGTRFGRIVHPSAIISDFVEIGEGAIIAAGCILTCNITIGAHAHLNLQTNIGHDCVIGDCFTTAPAACVSGNCRIGDRVYLGTGASVKQKIQIASDVTVGMNAGVVGNISNAGTYVGTPAKPLRRS